ncbi:MAG: hypothetical protein GX654_14210 [Desulfatiglans sp.]|nr:hypothetical protein [Desulfatiglans sp.]
MGKNILNAALTYRDAGLSVIPCNRDKTPALGSWTEYQDRIAAPKECQQWFRQEQQIAVICGRVSGALEIIDFDQNAASFEGWAKFVQVEAPGLLDRLIMEVSPHGVHIVYRCPEIIIPGNTKLASSEDKGTLIETRGEGGYCLVSPSKGYELKQGCFTDIPVISKDERAILIDAARACNQYIKPSQIQKGYQETKSGDLLPGQDFDQRGDVHPILERHGWMFKGTDKEGREQYARPGKVKGCSATLTDGKILYVFSSNADPFELNTAYSSFAVYAMLEHEGDFKAAARALAGQGYGISSEKDLPSQMKNSAPTMADLREYIDFCVAPGQKTTVDEICKGLSCYKRDERKIVYKNISRLCSEGVLKKDDYLHGGYRRAVALDCYDLGGVVQEDELNFNIVLPLELHNFISVKINQLLQVSGRYDAGKSTFLFQIMADNYQDYKIFHIVSEEWSLNAIKERMDILGIPRPHKNITVIPMRPGYEDSIPEGRCIVLIDYIRADQNPFETDAQIQRILRNLKGGIAIFATQKHPGLDRPVGGQFAIHASHHIVMLDKIKEYFTCKIYRTKNSKNLEGLYRTFKLNDQKRIYPVMDSWKQGIIKWDKEPFIKDGNDGDAGKFNAVKPGGTPVDKERKKERTKGKKKENFSSESGDLNQTETQNVDILCV